MRGFSLIELLIFIMVVGVIMTGLLLGFNEILVNSPQPERLEIARQIAEQRMEIILGQRHTVGYATFVDPCTAPPAVCPAIPAGYNITLPTVVATGDPNFSDVTVQVTGLGQATLRARVANY